jgi:predicted alpha/beta-hydrolase family hydrolase
VLGFLHSPAFPNQNGIVLTHGAGGNARAPLLLSLAESFCAVGFAVLRCDLPFRQAQSWRPPGPGDAARDRAGLKNAVSLMKRQVSGSVFLGGASYGGRQSTMLCAEQPELAAGLLLLSYPLHPPRKPEQLRTQHFTNLQTPGLFVHGTKDPFGTIEELQAALRLIPARTELLPVEGAGHDLGFKGKGRPADVPKMVVEQFGKFFS